jgi:hypothetical protein
MSTALNEQSRTVNARKLEELALDADEVHEVVQAAADRHDDPHLRLAAKQLDRLNDKLNKLTHEG